MKIILTENDERLLARYMVARDEFKAAKEAAGPKIAAIADLFDCNDLSLATPARIDSHPRSPAPKQ